MIARKCAIPMAPKVREFAASGQPLSNAGLKAYMQEHPDPEMDRAMARKRR